MEKGIADFIREFEAEKDFIFREASKRVSNSIVRLSPVDEGEYVADWDVKIGGWPSDTNPPNDPKKTKTRARLRQVIEGAKYGDAIFFENDDAAAIKLEFGYSNQAPQGVVRLTVRKWRGFVRGAARAAQNRIKKRLAGE